MRWYLSLLLSSAAARLVLSAKGSSDITSSSSSRHHHHVIIPHHALPVDSIAGSWKSCPLHVPTSVTKQSDAVDGPLLGNGAIGAVLGGPANNLTWYLGANQFFGGPSSGSSHCGYGQGGALQLGGVTIQTSSLQLAKASWVAAQNISRSYVKSAHTDQSGLVLTTHSYVAATDNVLEIELTLLDNATTNSTRTFLDFNVTLWTTPEMTWDSCSGNTVAFSGCGTLNGSRVPCNSTAAGSSPTLFAARSNGFNWQQVRSRGRGGLLEHGDWNITSEVMSLHVLSGPAEGSGSGMSSTRMPLYGARSVGDDAHDGGQPPGTSGVYRLPNGGNHGASARLRLPVGGSVTLHVVIYNQSHVGYRRGLSHGAARLQQLQHLTARMALRHTHDMWWREYWNASWISIPFSPLLERYYYGSQYLLGVSSRAGHAAPGIFGPFITVENGGNGEPASPWGGDYHMNYNGEAPFYGVGSSNHIDQGEPYLEALLAFVPQGRALARLSYGCPGIQVTGGLAPGGMIEGEEGDMGQRWQILMATLPFVERWRYTHDVAWARKVGLPFVAEVLEFWECWLVFNTTSGTFDDVNDEISELGFFSEERDVPWGQKMILEKNPIQTLAFLRFLLKGALEMTEAITQLGTPPTEAPPGRCAIWRKIQAGLANYSVVALAGGGADWDQPKPIYRSGLSGPEYYRTVHAIAPGTNDAVDLEIGRNTLAWMSEWSQGNLYPFVYTAAVRVRYNVTELLMQWESNLQGLVKMRYGHRGEIDPMFPPCDGQAERSGASGSRQCMGMQDNLYMRDGGGGIETIGATQSVNDMLMQSWRDVIELFPLVPDGSSAAFGSLRAVGGFLVSAARQADGVISTPVRVTSTVGGNVTVLAPWTGKTVSVQRAHDGHGVETAPFESRAGLSYQFETSAGMTYLLAPDAWHS